MSLASGNDVDRDADSTLHVLTLHRGWVNV